jgi:hypothetical protein
VVTQRTSWRAVDWFPQWSQKVMVSPHWCLLIAGVEKEPQDHEDDEHGYPAQARQCFVLHGVSPNLALPVSSVKEQQDEASD